MKIEYKLTRCGVARVLVPLIVFLLTFGTFISGCKSNNNSLLTLKNVTGAFEKDGLRLRKDNSLSSSDFEYQGIKPSIFKLDKIQGNLFVYVFKSYDDREQAYSHGSSEEKLSNFLGGDTKWVRFYQARNVLLAVTIPREETRSNPETIIYFQYLQSVDEVVFKRLNNGKEIVFKGEGPQWLSEITLKYYEHWWLDVKGVTQYDSYHMMDPIIVKYKGTDISNIGEVRYEYESTAGIGGSRSGAELGKDGYIRGGGGGGNGAFPREDNIFTMTVEWNGIKETFELRAEK